MHVWQNICLLSTLHFDYLDKQIVCMSVYMAVCAFGSVHIQKNVLVLWVCVCTLEQIAMSPCEAAFVSVWMLLCVFTALHWNYPAPSLTLGLNQQLTAAVFGAKRTWALIWSRLGRRACVRVCVCVRARMHAYTCLFVCTKPTLPPTYPCSIPFSL